MSDQSPSGEEHAAPVLPIGDLASDQGRAAEPSPAREGQPDELFLDDLSATRRFLTFVLSRGLEPAGGVPEQLAGLVSKFADAIEGYEHQVRESMISKRGWWRGRAPEEDK